MYHAHIYFDDHQSNLAKYLHQAIAQREDIDAIFPMVHQSVGPHSKPMFEVHFSMNTHLFCQWLDDNRGELSVLIHPVTLDALSDHTTSAIWLGAELPLKTDILL
ncbi:DOPA 4,5-dioxygenase family protein (plasmid) [Photobacterium sp. DA100]|uniref:DOPA 4,5-dioxygenase family protein n=1 Tax=Photobacterium sp. DA100 TaxID=3027472 RepID=UPI002478AE68|nr:DOPA 4,5-dioxygenase family protein [Photobacterium sp. DA100]WEM45307.1 DOPA 4,5-dioxygenase family protein [Photobacterium sp. DA100]